MQSNLFQTSMAAKCKAALSQASALTAESHGGLKGKFRELLVSELFRPTLPPEVKIGTGKLVSAGGSSSPQIDIILYAPAILPPFLFDDKDGYFPAESALYAIEVKSKLTSTELLSSVQNARATRTLPLLGTQHWSVDPLANPPIKSVTSGTPGAVNALFALDSDLVGNPLGELKRYFSADDKAANKPAIQALCVVGRGYWYSAKEGWKFLPADDQIGEVMSFLAGMTNTLPQLIASKGRPSFGNYLTTDTCKPQLVEM